MAAQKRILTKVIEFYFAKIDQFSVILRNFTLIILGFLDDLHTIISGWTVSLRNWARAAAGALFGAIIYTNPKQNIILKILLTTFKIIVGLPAIVVVFCILGVGVLVGGTLSAIVGLRNFGDYTFADQIAAWIVAIVFALFIPYIVGSYLLYKICLMGTFAIIIVGLNFLYGHCGIVSLGHAAFVLMGGYLTTLFYNGAFGSAFPFILSLFLSASVAAVFGLVLGGPSLRIKDEYLVIISLAFVIAVPQAMRSHYLTNFGGASGEGIEIKAIVPPTMLKWISPSVWGYYIIAASFFVLIGFAYNIHLKSQVGRAFALIKCDDVIARAQGVNVPRYKLLAFMLSAFYAAFAGGLVMILHPFVGSDSYSMSESIDYLIGLIVGGSGSIFGNVLGGAFLAGEEDMIKAASNLVNGGQNIMRVFYGIILVIMINFFPAGIGGLIQGKVRRKVMPRIRRGLYFMRPPPDYDYLEAKDYHQIDEAKEKNDRTSVLDPPNH